MSSQAKEKKQLKAQLAGTERQLQLLAERYALATSAAGVGIWDWNLESGEFYLDPNVKALLGYEDHEIPNDIEHWAEHIHPEDKDAVMGAAQDALEGRSRDYIYEHRMRHKDGSVRWFMVRGKVIRDSDGKAVRFVGTDTDITEKRELEQQIRDISTDLQIKIGHDLHDTLGQELTGVILKLGALEGKLRALSPDCSQETREIAALVSVAIDTTRALARGLSPVAESSGLAQSLSQLTDDVHRVFGIECRLELPPNLPSRFPRGHCNELYRIVQESITNAVRHGGAHAVKIEARVVRDRLLLSIVDDGTGQDIPDPSSESMGLKIMRYRARNLGGSVTISRRRDGGTLVVCSCPLPSSAV